MLTVGAAVRGEDDAGLALLERGLSNVSRRRLPAVIGANSNVTAARLSLTAIAQSR